MRRNGSSGVLAISFEPSELGICAAETLAQTSQVSFRRHLTLVTMLGMLHRASMSTHLASSLRMPLQAAASKSQQKPSRLKAVIKSCTSAPELKSFPVSFEASERGSHATDLVSPNVLTVMLCSLGTRAQRW